VLFAHGISDKGRVRPTNEDCFAIDEALGLVVVADGMGGHNAGEVAARLAVDAVVDVVAARSARVAPGGRDARFGDDSATDDEWPFGYDASLSLNGNLLQTGIHLANRRIFEAASRDDHYTGMGTTLVAARVWDGRLTVAHVGDSRLYLVADRQLRQVTQDDSWIAAMLATDPTADPLLLMHHPLRHALTSVVGARPRADVHVSEMPLGGGELLLVSTDGVHGVVDDARLERLLTEHDDPRAIANAVISTALTRGSRDNVTAVVARYQ
jgi:serine/threonine protein phosphatase PrpC